MAIKLWVGLLRFRDDGLSHGKVRYSTVWDGSIQGYSETSGFDDCGGHGHLEDGTAYQARIRTDG